MERITLTGENSAAVARRAPDVIRSGGVVLYPTDTLYGLGADALSDDAVAKIVEIKGRDERKPIHAIVSDIEMAERFAEISDLTRKLIARLPKGKVTYICKKKTRINSGICRDIETFGFRIPDNDFCIAMLTAFGGPITATSANRAGEESSRAIAGILAQLGHTADGIDIIIDAGELPECPPSTVLDLSSGSPSILRVGAVPASTIEAVLTQR